MDREQESPRLVATIHCSGHNARARVTRSTPNRIKEHQRTSLSHPETAAHRGWVLRAMWSHCPDPASHQNKARPNARACVHTEHRLTATTNRSGPPLAAHWPELQHGSAARQPIDNSSRRSWRTNRAGIEGISRKAWLRFRGDTVGACAPTHYYARKQRDDGKQVADSSSNKQGPPRSCWTTYMFISHCK